MSSLSASLDKMVAARAAGDLDSAEAIARVALEAHPHHPDATIALADLFVAQNRLDEAKAQLEAAVARYPTSADIHCHLAQVMVRMDQVSIATGEVFQPYLFRFPWGEFPFPLRPQFPTAATPLAEANLRRCLDLQPDHGEASSLLGGILLADEAHMAEAAERIQTGVRLAPDNPASHANMGALALRAGQYPIAVAAFTGARDRGDDGVEVAVRLVLAEIMNGDISPDLIQTENDNDRLEAWADGLRLVLRNPGIDAGHLETARMLGAAVAERLIHAAIRAVTEETAMIGSARLLDKAMMLYPGHPDAALALGALMLSINQFEAAAANIENSAKLGSMHPDHPRLWALARLCLGREVPEAEDLVTALDMQKLALGFCRGQDFDAAETWLRRAIAREPEDAAPRTQLASVLAIMGRIGEAIDVGEAALRLNPDDPRARLGLYGHYLANGDPAKAWPMYESRLEIFRSDSNRGQPNLPRWDGQDLSGKRLLVWREEGIGDEVLFASFLSAFMKRWPCDVTFECSARLLPLLRRSLPGVTMQTEEGRQDSTAGADFHLPAGSLMMHVRRSLEDYAESVPFLIPDPVRLADYRQRLASLGEGLKLGLSWQSANKSWAKMPLAAKVEDMAPFFEIEGVTYFNLQFGDTARELQQLNTGTGAEILQFEDLDLRNDLDGVAAFITALDGVVSARGWIATFSGFVGQRTYCFSAPPNTYGLGQARCPWAPDIEFFSRTYGESWSKPIGTIVERIREDVRSG